LKVLKILLINPKWNGFGNRKKIKVSEKKVHPLTLGIIAGIILKHNSNHQVTIVNQSISEISFGNSYDLVGITVNTYTAPIAYEIADKFRKNKVKVLLGGVHATLCPDECQEHADTTLSGEAEELLPQILDDLLCSQLKPFYQANAVEDLHKIPFPRRDLFSAHYPNAAFVQATRGCNNACTFCYLRDTPWQPFRKRPVNDVINEIKAIQQKVILFVDDNMFVDRDYCLHLFSELKKIKKYWWAQAPTTLAYDNELLSAAADSGCFSLSYGFQTINESAIQGQCIIQNKIENYKSIVKKSQDLGIFVDGTFIFGFETDEKEIFRNTVNAIKDMGLDSYTLYILTVYPSTENYSEYLQNKKLTTTDLSKFDWDHATIFPGKISTTELENGIKWAYQELDKFYRWRLLSKAFKNMNLLLKSPELVRFLISSGLQRKYYNNY
jgi:radical SAM superfamily enzyme YgiQ (UPF0313 family)